MKSKERHSAPKCEGRFGELRAVFYETARDLREIHENPLWSVRNYQDLKDATEWILGENMEMVPLYDATDPYFGNQRDILRGDPLVGNPENWRLALTPFVFEGMREILYEAAQDAREKIKVGGTTPDLERVANRDFTISQNSVYTGLLDDYARIYLNETDVDRLRLIHRGVEWLDKDLGIDMSKVMVPTKKNGQRKDYVPLSGYFMKAEFGTGLNTSRNLVSSAPYRLELHKREDACNALDALGHPLGKPVLGLSFYLKHPDTAVVYQVQDIRGERVPAETTDGLCGLTLMEKVGTLLGLKKLVTYNHNTNPVRYLYPNDRTLANVLKLNFDEAAHRLGWAPIVTHKDGHIDGYEKSLSH
ncbi:MAG: hypothetical protein Q8P81_03755 [Nanoarchaeota archaeon]|nr:hypothetical protein [Nanoarchaeota archaeon]